MPPVQPQPPLIQPLGDPHLDHRLPRYAEPSRLLIERGDHPYREVDRDPPKGMAGTSRLAHIKVLDDVLARIEPGIKFFRLHDRASVHVDSVLIPIPCISTV